MLKLVLRFYSKTVRFYKCQTQEREKESAPFSLVIKDDNRLSSGISTCTHTHVLYDLWFSWHIFELKGFNKEVVENTSTYVWWDVKDIKREG